MLDGRRLMDTDPRAEDFTETDPDAAWDHIWMILDQAVAAQQAVNAITSHLSSVPAVAGARLALNHVLDKLPSPDALKWHFCNWSDLEAIDEWERWSPVHRQREIPALLASLPLGHMKGKNLVSPRDTPTYVDPSVGHPPDLDTSGQRRAWSYLVPGAVSFMMFIGTAKPGKTSRQGANQRNLHNNEQRAKHPRVHFVKAQGPRRTNTQPLATVSPQ